ncbi:DUF2726 domain-containing protein [Nitrospira sp. NS4]|uniref:DUF2726 domain-containing protein n=1 Tax=Nitrospira sp. NS4 TaxID=3414498 RepID=UPI003C301FDF
MDAILIGVVAAGVLLLVFWERVQSPVAANTQAPVLPAGVTLAPAPLLTEQEVVLYNLIRMAVQDHYLVFSKVPLWAFVRIDAAGKARAQIFRDIALKPVDFVLLHPGTREVAQVVQVEDVPSRGPQADRAHVVRSVLEAAGIKLVMLRSQHAHSVPVLASLLGLDPEES